MNDIKTSRTTKNKNSPRDIPFVTNDSRRGRNQRPLSAAYPLPTFLKKKQRLSYAINAFPLFNTLRQIELDETFDQYSLETYRPKLIDERFLCMLKQKTSAERILQINADDPYSESSKCLKLI